MSVIEILMRQPLAPAVAGSPTPWLPLVVALWMGRVAILSLRLASAWVWVQGMKRHRAVAAAERWQESARKLARQLHIGRPVRLLESAAVSVPTVIGWLRPVVLLPVSVLAALSPQQVEAILAHELAHVRRHDYLVNLLQTVVETLLFYHPAVWWLSGRIRAEREHCCDHRHRRPSRPLRTGSGADRAGHRRTAVTVESLLFALSGAGARAF